MALVFYSQIPSHLKINGNYIGVIGNNPKLFSEFNENAFMEFLPINKEFAPIYSTLKNPACIKTFKLLDDIYVIPVLEKKRNLSYKLLFQKSYPISSDRLLLTVIQDGFYKFYLDGAISYLGELPFKPQGFDVKEHLNILFISFKGVKTLLLAFDLNGNKLLYKNLADGFEITSELLSTTVYKTVIPVQIEEKYNLNDFSLIERKSTPLRSRFEIHPKLIPTAFFELVALSANTAFLLSDSIKNREGEISAFIGKPIVVLPYYKDISKTVVILNDSIHLYSLQIENGLIENILEE